MKVWAYVAIIISVLAAFGATYAKGHSSGYDKKEGEVQQSILDAQENARKTEEQKWSAAVAAAQANTRIEERIVEKIHIVEKEVPRVVKEIIEVNAECRDLGPAYSGLLNDQVRAANSLQSTEAPPGLDDRVPGS